MRKLHLLVICGQVLRKEKKTEQVTDSHRHFIKERIVLDNKNQERAIEWDSLRNKYQV